MSSKWCFGALAFAVVGGAATIGVLVVRSGQVATQSKADIGSMRRRLTAALPVGSSVEQVMGYLERERLDHTGYIRDPIMTKDDRTIVAHAKSSGISFGWPTGPIRHDIRAEFSFDAHDKLKRIEVLDDTTGF